MRDPATFVLVHGSGHGGWCWYEVGRLLRAEGCDVYTPTLAGVGERTHLAACGIDLNTHVVDVANLLFYEDLSDVVLVGHSYGGTVVTAVAATAPERLGMLIYLDGYVPDPGQCQYDLWPPEVRAELESGAAASRGMRPPPTPELMGIDDPELADWARARLTPHPLATYRQTVPAGGVLGDTIPRAYVRCTAGPMVSLLASSAAKAAARGWMLRDVDAGHDAMLTAPVEVARVLLELSGVPR